MKKIRKIRILDLWSYPT